MSGKLKTPFGSISVRAVALMAGALLVTGCQDVEQTDKNVIRSIQWMEIRDGAAHQQRLIAGIVKPGRQHCAQFRVRRQDRGAACRSRRQGKGRRHHCGTRCQAVQAESRRGSRQTLPGPRRCSRTGARNMSGRRSCSRAIGSRRRRSMRCLQPSKPPRAKSRRSHPNSSWRNGTWRWRSSVRPLTARSRARARTRSRKSPRDRRSFSFPARPIWRSSPACRRAWSTSSRSA